MTNVSLFYGAREAKEFLVSKIVEEALHQGTPLSEAERKMLCFSETDWTLPDMSAVSDEFDRAYDQDEYEAKIAGLVKNAYKKILKDSGDEYDKWWSAIRLLSKQDHYILVMIRQAALRPRGDQLKLFGTAAVVAGLFVCFVFVSIYLEGRYRLDFGKYMPSRDTRQFLWWAILVSLTIIYFLLRRFIGERRVDNFVANSLAGLGRTFNRSK
jgi:hypothetical protein